jgi:Bacterial Ig-like domain (group 3)
MSRPRISLAGFGRSFWIVVLTFLSVLVTGCRGQPSGDEREHVGIATQALTASTVAVTSNVASSVFGQPVTFTAKVTPASGGPATGSVTFLDGATSLGVATLDAAQEAFFTTSTLAVGGRTITVRYEGDAAFDPSTSDPLTQAVAKAATTTALASSANPSILDQAVTLTATVTATAPGAGTPSGSVTFSEGAATLGTGTLDATGRATLAIPSFALGTHDVVAVYNGDGSFDGSSAPTLVQTVSLDGPTLTLAASASPSPFGVSVTFTATVASSGAAPVPTGTVTFSDGVTDLGTGTLDATGKATFSTSALTAGTHTINASYGGDAHHTSATGSLAHTISPGPSTTAVQSLTNPSVFGQPVQFKVTVTGTGATPTGNVTLKDGTTSLGTQPLNGAAQTTFTISSLAAGSHTITATYAGDTNFATSTSASLTQTVNKAATTTTVASSSNPSIAGASVTFTATVSVTSPGVGVPGGTVTFKDGTTNICSTVAMTSGVATCATSTLTVAAHSITAVYNGDSNFNTSTSAVVTQTVDKDGVTATLTSSVNPSNFGASLVFTATVTTVGPGGTPTGSVQFKEGAATLSTVTLNSSGVATYTNTTLPAGNHTITAVYGGDTKHNGGSSSDVVQTINKSNPTTSVVASPNPSVFGQGVTLTVSVASPGAGTPTGTVTLSDGATTLGSSALSSGRATFPSSALVVGNHPLTATYTGDSNFNAGASTSYTHVVNKATTVMSVVSSTNPSAGGAEITLLATVVAVAPGKGTPTGTVTFKEGTTIIGTATLDTFAAAKLKTSSLAIGSHSIVATYDGDASFKPYTAAPLKQTVTAEGATVKLTASPSPAKYGSSVTLTAKVSSTSATPTGTVTFLDGDATLGTGTIDATGAATFTTTKFAVGTRNLTAKFSGDTFHAAAEGSTTLVVEKGTTSIEVASSLNPSKVGENVTFTATLTTTVEGATGSVEFRDGDKSIGSAQLAGNSVQFTTSALGQGGHAITAIYSGDANFVTSTSVALTQTVTSDVTTEAPPPDNGTGGGDTGGGGCAAAPRSASGMGGTALLALGGVGVLLARRRRRSQAA